MGSLSAKNASKKFSRLGTFKGMCHEMDIFLKEYKIQSVHFCMHADGFNIFWLFIYCADI
jgi:hypothetical protein